MKNAKDIEPKDMEPENGANAPLETRVITIRTPIDEGIQDNEIVEEALADFRDEAKNSQRVITGVQVYITPLGNDLVYTVIAEWVGIETLKQMQRMNAIAAGNANGGKMGLV